MAIETLELRTKSGEIYQHTRNERLGCLGNLIAIALFQRQEFIEHPWVIPAKSEYDDPTNLKHVAYVSSETADQLYRDKASLVGDHNKLIRLVKKAREIDPGTRGGKVVYVYAPVGNPELHISEKVVMVTELRKVNQDS